ncbi:MAG TPA: hypothetical protein VIV54_04090 [Burkholderiales bacterium]
MDAITSNRSADDAQLERELEELDWARTAGVSAEELRQALQASMPGPELRKAA